MGTGTEPNPTRTADRQADSPLDDGVQVHLTPADVWVLGQLVEDGSLSLPSTIDEDIRNGYRILRTAGWDPPPTLPDPDAGAGQTTELSGALREVQLAEIVSAETPEPEGHQPSETERVAMATPEVDIDPLASAHERLAGAVERLAGEAESPIELSIDEAIGSESSPTQGLSRLLLDWSVIGIGAVVSTLFVVASALVADPVFAILGLGLLAVTAALAYPYLTDREGPP